MADNGNKQLNKQLKKGKSPDQCKAVDYFFPVGGCLGGKGPKDDEYSSIVLALINKMGSKEHALGKIGMDEDQVNEIAPVFFWGYESNDVHVGDTYAAKLGDDGHWRSSRVSCTWLFFSNEQVFMYHIELDLLSDAKKENTEEYFYRDITNFSTSTKTVESIKTTTGCMGKENVEKKNTDTNMFSLIVPGDKFTCSVSGISNVDDTIKGMKNKLREKKSAL